MAAGYYRGWCRTFPSLQKALLDSVKSDNMQKISNPQNLKKKEVGWREACDWNANYGTILKQHIPSLQLHYVKPNKRNSALLVWWALTLCSRWRQKAKYVGRNFIYKYWLDTCHGHTQTTAEAKIQLPMNVSFTFLQEEARLSNISSWTKFTAETLVLSLMWLIVVLCMH